MLKHLKFHLFSSYLVCFQNPVTCFIIITTIIIIIIISIPCSVWADQTICQVVTHKTSMNSYPPFYPSNTVDTYSLMEV